ncbi:MAG: macro domain-containing protein [Candidatus Thermoplasmatota archaeon]|nr:macro domain-containing protein [Candidatus Thermoplasmatota archaeon]MEC8384354.1 macro domain-containing protein [Candidatus Thermoplasmatota archaeon]MEC9173633.1 macro domain-containing protein [Candidatus Thermoplasmatota archaeon]|tara:strand:- start:606 stop:1244 length:639 start_codon:yes stop_codon:yes gene_type:complete
MDTLIVRDCKHAQLRILVGDVLKAECDILVTGANNRLSGREGIDARIHKAAGDELREACSQIARGQRALNLQPCSVGSAVSTSPFNLPVQHLIHVVGPDCRRPNQDLNRRELLEKSYNSMFEQIASSKIRGVVALAPISMDVFSYPHREGARKTMEILLGILDGEEDPGIERLLLVTDNTNFISNMKTVYRETEDQFPGSDLTRAFRRGLIQ